MNDSTPPPSEDEFNLPFPVAAQIVKYWIEHLWVHTQDQIRFDDAEAAFAYALDEWRECGELKYLETMEGDDRAHIKVEPSESGQRSRVIYILPIDKEKDRNNRSTDAQINEWFARRTQAFNRDFKELTESLTDYERWHSTPIPQYEITISVPYSQLRAELLRPHRCQQLEGDERTHGRFGLHFRVSQPTVDVVDRSYGSNVVTKLTFLPAKTNDSYPAIAYLCELERRHFTLLTYGLINQEWPGALKPMSQEGLTQDKADSQATKSTELKKRRGGPKATEESHVQQIIAEWEAAKGKEIQEAFCKRKGIGVSTLTKWIRERSKS